MKLLPLSFVSLPESTVGSAVRRPSTWTGRWFRNSGHERSRVHAGGPDVEADNLARDQRVERPGQPRQRQHAELTDDRRGVPGRVPLLRDDAAHARQQPHAVGPQVRRGEQRAFRHLVLVLARPREGTPGPPRARATPAGRRAAGAARARRRRPGLLRLLDPQQSRLQDVQRPRVLERPLDVLRRAEVPLDAEGGPRERLDLGVGERGVELLVGANRHVVDAALGRGHEALALRRERARGHLVRRAARDDELIGQPQCQSRRPGRGLGRSTPG